MSVLTPKRVFLVVLLFLATASALANNPSPRTLARMAFDEQRGEAIVFGGRGSTDSATGVAHSSAETWAFSGYRWAQRFPAVSPPARAAHAMAYDSTRGRIVLFGGFAEPATIRDTATLHNDTWVWENGNWTQIVTATSPDARYYPAMAYDSARDRMVLFGGVRFSADGKTAETLQDTWEFDGFDWTRVGTGADGVKAGKPALAYDPTRDQMVLVGLNETLATAMYIYDSSNGTWAAPSPAPEKLPTCANEGVAVYQTFEKKIAYVGGTCAVGTPQFEEVWEWDGTTWTKVTTNPFGKAVGQAGAYDSQTYRLLLFGGIGVGDALPSSTMQFYRNGIFQFNPVTLGPRPRSLAAMATDSTNGALLMFGGLNEYSAGYSVDFWRVAGEGQWNIVGQTTDTTGPSSCQNPGAAHDSERGRWVLICYGSDVFEWDGATWKGFSNLSPKPNARKFYSTAYDATLKKVVMYGGYDEFSGNFRQDTWTWDGTKWAEVKNTRPPNRSLTMMWYDPHLSKTVIYGGVGRNNLDQRVTRYDDMWSFDGAGWTKMSVSSTPGPRLGAQIALNPNTNRLLLFGGLRAEKLENDTTRQYYDNDTWEWNGANNTWSRLDPATVPAPRENGMMGWDPVAGRITLFAGYKGGLYLSDVWYWDGTNWTPHITKLGRNRAARK